MDHARADRLLIARLERMEEERKQGRLPGIRTGIDLLDTNLGYLQPSRLIVVGARPKMGKTAFATTTAMTAAKAGHRVLFLSLEMSPEDLDIRYVAHRQHIGIRHLATGELDQSMWSTLATLLTEPEPWWENLVTVGLRRPTPPLIGARIAAATRHGFELVVIDYLQMMSFPPRDRHIHVGEAVHVCKDAAMRAKVPVVLLSQLNRQSEGSGSAPRRPRASDLRDSGEIEQTADQVLLLYRPSEAHLADRNEADDPDEIIVAANRHGPAGRIEAYFDEIAVSWTNPRPKPYAS